MTNVNRNQNGAVDPQIADTSDGSADNGGKQQPMEAESQTNFGDTSAISPIDPEIQKHLGQKLKASYDELVRQPVPDKFRLLLEELELRGKNS